MEIGLYSFADLQADPGAPGAVSAAVRLRQLLEEIALADEVGLDVFGLGEHHRRDFAVSAPAIVLAAAAERTKRIRLSSAVTVLSSEDPVRVFQQYATLDLVSGGRAEIMAGRGSFIESFPLFGFELDDYDELFAEKLELLLQLREREEMTWSGRFRAPLRDRLVWPRPAQEPFPVWVAVGGNPQSAVRAGLLGLSMALAIIGGETARFRPFAEVHRDAARHAGHPVPRLSLNLHGFVAPTSQEAADVSFPYVKAAMDTIGRERGWPPLTRAGFDAGNTLHGHNVCGSPEQVIEKLLYQHEVFGHDRVLIKVSVGAMPHEQVMRSIELLGTEVAPAVRAEVARRTAAPAGA